jgi:hypothetical protein
MTPAGPAVVIVPQDASATAANIVGREGLLLPLDGDGGPLVVFGPLVGGIGGALRFTVAAGRVTVGVAGASIVAGGCGAAARALSRVFAFFLLFC